MRDNTCIADLPEPITQININYLPEFDIMDYDLSDPKDTKKYFVDLERMCRNSRAYKKLIAFLREYVDMTHCSFYENINNLDTYSIKIHIHHSPLTLFDIATTIFAKRIANHESIALNLVAKEVMYVHDKMMVGLIPLSETVHELVHNGYLFIPTNAVYGLYQKFLDTYGMYMDETTKKTLESAEEYTQAYDYAKETKVLTMRAVYIDPSGSYQLPNIQDIANVMQTKLNEFDSNRTEITLGSDIQEINFNSSSQFDKPKKQVVEFVK